MAKERVNADAIYTPRKGEVLLIRGDLNGKNVDWGYKLTEAGVWVPGAERFQLRLEGIITGSSFIEGLDARLAQQRENIDRLLDHLKQDCPKLNGSGECPHIVSV